MGSSYCEVAALEASREGGRQACRSGNAGAPQSLPGHPRRPYQDVGFVCKRVTPLGDEQQLVKEEECPSHSWPAEAKGPFKH